MRIPTAIRRAVEIGAAYRSMSSKRAGGARRRTAEKRPRRTRPRDLETAARQSVEVLDRLGVRWTLVGAGAYSVLVEPRATEDFDFVVEADKLASVLDALRARFGKLDTTDVGAAVRVKDPPLDLIRSSTHALFAVALDRTRVVGGWRVPSPEVFVALKFLAAVSAWRGPDRKAQDVADLIRVYLHYGRARLDMRLIARLAAQVYPGAQRELRELLRRVDAGEPIVI